MVPGRWCPGGSGVTILAGSGKSHDIMIGIVGIVVICRMARITVGRRILIAVGVAGETWQRCMGSG